MAKPALDKKMVVELNVKTVIEARKFVEQLSNYYGMYMIDAVLIFSLAKWLIESDSDSAVEHLRGMRELLRSIRSRIFLDANLSGTPEVVESSAKMIMALKVGAVSFSGHGSTKAIRQVINTAHESNSASLIFGNALLPDMSPDGLSSNILEPGQSFVSSLRNIPARTKEMIRHHQTKKLVQEIQAVGAHGIVVAPSQVETVRKHCRSGLIVCARLDAENQTTPEDARAAIDKGADWIVISSHSMSVSAIRQLADAINLG